MTRKQNSASLSIEDVEVYLNHLVAWLQHKVQPHQRELAGFGLLVSSLLALLYLLGFSGGFLPDTLGGWAESLFGWGAIPTMLAVGVLGGKLLWHLVKPSSPPLPLESVIGMELALLAMLVILHITAGGNDPLALANEHGGGGYVGWALATLLGDFLGQWFTGFIFLLLGLAGIGLVLRFSLSDTMEAVASHKGSWSQQPLPQSEATPADASWIDKLRNAVSLVQGPPKPQAKKQAIRRKKATTGRPARKAPARPSKALQAQLPPLDLLAPAKSENGLQIVDARYQAKTIEETLTSFGVPVQVVEINAGPTVTQFGLKPGTITRKGRDGEVIEQRIRVNKISALSNDLALALAASPIRIETPVPGRPIVGIEVPNSDIGMVSLRGAMEEDDFWRAKGHLKVALGRGVSGKTNVIDLTAMPHLLIAGATGSGKSVCINTIITSLLMTHTPDTLRMLMIDPKMVELISYNGIPHLIAPVVTDFEQVGGALAWTTREMERRYKAFATVGARSIGGYNKQVAKEEKLPFLVVIIDELADLMMLAADEVERYICRIAQMARATGIHLIIATQRPSADVVTGLIKANFPSRIAFAVSSQIDSRVIIDTPGAEKLLGKGDMLYMASDSPQLARLQGCFVSDGEINQVVRFWKQRDMVATAVDVDETEPEDNLPWADIMAEANKDDMLKQAIEIVVKSGRASTTMLQRKLGVGYPRASRLMDQLEEEGVVAPAEGNNARTVLWIEDTGETTIESPSL